MIIQKTRVLRQMYILHFAVVVEVLGDTVTDANADGKVREAAFEVILPVTGIEYKTVTTG